MKKFEFMNGAFHVFAACAYGLICYKTQTFDIYAMLAIAMSGIGVCYIGQYLKSRKNDDEPGNH